MTLKKLALATSAALLVSTVSAHHNTMSDDGVMLQNCVIQETIPGAKHTGAFLNIHKMSEKELALVAAQVPSITDHVEIHEMIMKDGTMKMQKIEKYDLEEGDNLFKKGGYHIMLMGLAGKTVKVGEKHNITLKFSDDSEKTCEAEVKSVAELTKGGKMHDMSNMKHDMKEMRKDMPDMKGMKGMKEVKLEMKGEMQHDMKK